MKVSDFDFELPPERIAQRPASRRDHSRLMVVAREHDSNEHRQFGDLPDLLNPGDLLVLNDTRVRAARLVGAKPTGGRVELLLLAPLHGSDRTAVWSCLIRASRGTPPGCRIELGEDVQALVEAREEDHWRVGLSAPDDLEGRLERLGRMPLPPYIRRDSSELDALDRERYQTVYAERPGAVAAPTAGLHFTRDLLARLAARGVRSARVTLHVGIGTFQPVRVDQVEQHRMHGEWFELPEPTALAVAEARSHGGRVVAVGTTVVRTLEGRSAEDGTVAPGQGWCDLFIYPGYAFRAVDAVVTNLHLPRSSLLMLVSAFTGRDRILAAYREAVARNYRFYSYGDAMLLL